MRERARVVLGVWYNFGHGDVLGGSHEPLEFPVGHRRSIHPEAVNGNLVRWSFFGIMPVRSHAKSATGYPDHPLSLGEGIKGSISKAPYCSEMRRHFRMLPPDRSPKTEPT